MLTPKIIVFVYWLLLIGCLVSGLEAIFTEHGGGLVAGLRIIIGGIISARIGCELVIILFRIHENLEKS